MSRLVKYFVLILLFMFSALPSAMAAVGCSLKDPDRDIRKLFPESTGYRTMYTSIPELGGEALYNELQQLLGDPFDSVYETIEVPYTYYVVLKGKDPIAYVHGVNQKGMYGGMQIIITIDIEGKVLSFYYQKISSPESKKFRDKTFTDQFTGLTLNDFFRHDGQLSTGDAGDPIAAIKDPSEKSQGDFHKTLRGLKKNLLLIDVFCLNKKHINNVINTKGGMK